MHRRNFVNKSVLVMGGSLVGANYLSAQNLPDQFHSKELEAIESFSNDFEKSIAMYPNSANLTSNLLNPKKFISRKSTVKGYVLTYRNQHLRLVKLEKSGKEFRFKFL